MGDMLIGFDIGGTKCAVVLGRTTDSGVEILDRRQFATLSANGPEYALTKLEETTRLLMAEHGLDVASVRGIGISCGGPLDSERGLILGPPNLPGWDRVPITDRFRQSFGIPVFLQNDANACALAEWRWGAGRGTRNMIFLTFGTGLGAGLILDGRIYSGTNDLAGEVGHVRLAEHGPVGYGKEGSFEGFCSGGGIARIARRIAEERLRRGERVSFCGDDGDLNGITASTVAEAAASGDEVALGIFRTVGERLGQGLAMLIDILNPQAIVIGSIFTRQESLLRPHIERIIAAEALPLASGVCRVLPAALGESIGDYAALSVAACGGWVGCRPQTAGCSPGKEG